ncbi:hypothetical protein EU546_00750, partial [Candidatus Thorarchaeota archaeon]
MARKRSRKRGLTKSSFRTKGKHSKMKVDDKKAKAYYFSAKIEPDKAKKIAAAESPDILGVPQDSIKIRKPSLRYDFYCEYEAELSMSFLRVRKEELSVNEQVKGALVGKEVFKPRKGREIPGPALKLDIVELFEIERTDEMILDGKTGGPAKVVEKIIKHSRKKRAKPAWIQKQRVASGKFNSIAKVVRAVSRAAKKKPSGTKRVVSHELDFKKL